VILLSLTETKFIQCGSKEGGVSVLVGIFGQLVARLWSVLRRFLLSYTDSFRVIEFVVPLTGLCIEYSQLYSIGRDDFREHRFKF
jgi:hypothetical protein